MTPKKGGTPTVRVPFKDGPEITQRGALRDPGGRGGKTCCATKTKLPRVVGLQGRDYGTNPELMALMLTRFSDPSSCCPSSSDRRVKRGSEVWLGNFGQRLHFWRPNFFSMPQY